MWETPMDPQARSPVQPFWIFRLIRKLVPVLSRASPSQLPAIASMVEGPASDPVDAVGGTDGAAETLSAEGVRWTTRVTTPVITAAPTTPMAVHASPPRRRPVAFFSTE